MIKSKYLLALIVGEEKVGFTIAVRILKLMLTESELMRLVAVKVRGMEDTGRAL